MATTKASATLLASTSNAAGGTTNSTALDLSTAYGAVLSGTMTNGSTAPTIACTATCQVSIDGTTWDVWQSATASAAASTATAYAFEIPLHAIRVRVSFSGNTGQAVACLCRAQYTTAI